MRMQRCAKIALPILGIAFVLCIVGLAMCIQYVYLPAANSVASSTCTLSNVTVTSTTCEETICQTGGYYIQQTCYIYQYTCYDISGILIFTYGGNNYTGQFAINPDSTDGYGSGSIDTCYFSTDNPGESVSLYPLGTTEKGIIAVVMMSLASFGIVCAITGIIIADNIQKINCDCCF